MEVEKSAEGTEGMKEEAMNPDLSGREGAGDAGTGSRLHEARAVDPELSAKATRRHYSAQYKLRILKEAETLKGRDLGALLRREGLYRSHLITWKKQREKGELEGLSPRKRGRKPNPDTQLIQKCARFERENERLNRKIEQMETIIEFQKKMADLLKRSEETPNE